MKALKKKKKLYENGGKTDPPKKGFKSRKRKLGERQTYADVTSNVMGLPGVRVYSQNIEGEKPIYDKEGNPRYHKPGDTFAPSYNLHKKTGLYRQGHGQVTRPVDPSKSPYIKNVVKGSKGARSAGKK